MTDPSPSPGAGDPSAANADPPRPDNGGSSEANTTPAVHDAQAAAESYDKQLAALRKSADLSSKALGAIATTVATAFGVTKLSSVFPQPSGVDWGWFLVLYGGLAVALAGVVLIASRLWNVGQPIPTQSDVHNMKVEAGLDAGEERLVRGVYQEAANLQNAGLLLAYEARGYRLERAAS